MLKKERYSFDQGFSLVEFIYGEDVDTSIYKEMLEKAEKCDYRLPFPMGVFGTLRLNCGNHRLMTYGGNYKTRRLGFLPNFFAKGLRIGFEAGSSAPFEVYDYDPKTWDNMIDPVDSLEGFDSNRGTGWYQRTLVWLHLLPEDFTYELFPERPNLRDYRNLEIPPADWDKFEKVPTWVYSGAETNKEVIAYGGYPIIW